MVYDSYHRKLKINVELEYDTMVTDYLIRGMLDTQLRNFNIKNIEIIELSRELVKGDDE